MFARILEKCSKLVSQGLRTDKGFKDVQLNAVAKDLQEFMHQPVTHTQVYNHLHKWRAKWIRICRLKDLSGALWDEGLCMITMDPEHYNGHVKVSKVEVTSLFFSFSAALVIFLASDCYCSNFCRIIQRMLSF